MAWLDDWGKRIKFKVTGGYVFDNLTDFPVMITLSSGCGLNTFNATGVFDELTPTSGTVVFTEDFTASGTQWTHQTGTTSYASGYMSHDAATSSDRTTNTIYFGQNYEILMRLRNNVRGNGGHYTDICFAYDDASTNYQIELRHYTYSSAAGSTCYLRMSKKSGTTATVVVTDGQYHYYNDYTNWFWVRIIRKDNDLYFKIWRHPATEPKTWTYEIKNVFETYSYPDTGYIRMLCGTTGGANYYNYDDIQVKIFDSNNKYNPTLAKSIAVTDSDGLTQLPVEIESWQPEYKLAYLWTKVPNLVLGTDKILYLYYDKNKYANESYVGFTNTAPASQVWGSNFVFVMHCNSQPMNSVIYDSTANSNDSTASSMDSIDWFVTPAGMAYVFNSGSSDRIDFGNLLPVQITGSLTVESLCKPYGYSASYRRGVSSKGLDYSGGSVNRSSWSLEQTTTNRWRFGICPDGVAANFQWAQAAGATVANTWYYLTGIYTPSTSVELRVDMTTEAIYTTSVASGIYNTTDVLTVGCCSRIDNVYSYFDGEIAEVRVSNTVRSTAWLNTTYKTLYDQLLTFDGIENRPAFYYQGYVTEKGSPVERTVRLYKRDDGTLVDETVSASGNGYYYLTTSTSGEHFIVAFDDNLGDEYNALILDRLDPTGTV